MNLMNQRTPMLPIHPIGGALRPRTRSLLLCALMATPLWALAPPALAADDEHPDAAESSWARLAALPLPAYRAAAEAAGPPEPEPTGYALMLSSLAAAGLFMWHRRRD